MPIGRDVSVGQGSPALNSAVPFYTLRRRKCLAQEHNIVTPVHTAVKREAHAQYSPKLSLNKVLNFRTFSLSSPKLRQSLKS